MLYHIGPKVIRCNGDVSRTFHSLPENDFQQLTERLQQCITVCDWTLTDAKTVDMSCKYTTQNNNKEYLTHSYIISDVQ